MAKEGLSNKENENPVVEMAKRLGANVTYPEIKTKSGKTIRIMRVEKTEQGKDLGLDFSGPMIMAYKAEGYNLNEFKSILVNLGVLKWMYFFPGEEKSWPATGPKGWRQIVEPYPNGSFLP